MSSNYAAVSMDSDQIKFKKISFPFLLIIYSILPVCILAYLIDIFLLHGYLKATLPLAPENYLILSFIFGTPHIVASNIIFFTNKDYLNTYGKKFLIATIAIIAFFCIGNFLLSEPILLAMVATATSIHVVKQQLGVGNIIAKLSGKIYNLWMWAIIGASVLFYNGIFLSYSLSPGFMQIINDIIFLSVFVIVGASYINHNRIKTKMGRHFLLVNTSMVLLSIFFYFQKYYFFAIVGPRLVHDLTAFVFYVVHDYNRHHASPRNWMYKIFNKLKISAFIAVPVIAISITIYLQVYGDQQFTFFTQSIFNRSFSGAISLGFILYLGLIHYYMESFTWKGDSPYRKYIGFNL